MRDMIFKSIRIQLKRDNGTVDQMRNRNALFFLILLLFTSFIGCARTNRIQELISQHTGRKSTEYMAFRNPSLPPQKTVTMLPEWAPISHLILSDNCVTSIFPDDDEENQFFVDFILKAAEYVRVLVVISDESRLEKMLSMIQEKESLFLVEDETIEFIFAIHDSKWVRDYGPFFGRDHAGQIFCFDTMYNNIRVGEDYEPRPNDEILPQFLLSYLKTQMEHVISIRVPYFLNGGDFYTDGKGICYLSTQTILSNGGNFEDAELILKHYFGAKECIFLDSLPPDIIIPHIDMFFKLVNENTCLLGHYNQRNQDPILNIIQSWCNDILEKNLTIIRKARPDMKIFSVPMPNIEKRSGHPFDSHFKKITDIIKKNQSDPVLASRISDDPLPHEYINLENLAMDLLRDFQQIKSIAMQKKLLGVQEYHYVTRTYINSLFVNGKKKAVLLPFYQGYEDLNNEARSIYEKAYNEAYEGVDIVPVYSDILIPFDGAIHCITNTIPAKK